MSGMDSETIEMESPYVDQMYQFDSSDYDDTDDDYSDEDESDEKREMGDIQDHSSVRNILAECSTFADMEIIECYDGDKIKEGQRVVRGFDWNKGDEDGGEGNVGTVIEILNDAKEVRVQWDSLNDAEEKDMYKYRTGLDGKYDLRLFDNSQTGVHHKFLGCNVCEESPIIGMRWRCLYCEDYDLCTVCYMYDEHNIKHPFERHQGMKTISDNVGIRAELHYLTGKGIFIGAHVKSRKGPKIEGRVIDMVDSIPLYNCDAKVIWEGKPARRCRVGRNGEVDIKFKVPAEVPYIEDHLQKISEANQKLHKNFGKPRFGVTNDIAYLEQTLCCRRLTETAECLVERDNEDSAVVGLRVVKKTNDERSTVGTIIAIKKDEVKNDQKEKGQRPKQRKSGIVFWKYPGDDPQKEQTLNCVTVQWDDGEAEYLETYAVEILLFDNSQIGIRHSAICKECKSYERIKGIRWNCSKCPEYDLCTSCYMSEMDDHTDHLFYRITYPTKGYFSRGEEGKRNRTKLEKPRTSSELKRKSAKGIFKDAQVQQLNDNTGRVGKVIELLHFKIKTYRCNVVVETKNSKKYRGQITEYQRVKGGEQSSDYYPLHLPDYGKDIQGYVKVKDKKKKIKFDVEFLYQKDTRPPSSAVQHSLYLIFAQPNENQSQNDEDKFQLLEDVEKFARKSKVPCQMFVEKILFSSEVVVIHYLTRPEVIKKLIELGVRKFIRGDTDEGMESERQYFLRMYHYLNEKIPLPVFISLRNGVHSTDAVIHARKDNIPVICFKRKAEDVFVLTFKGRNTQTEHRLNLKTPWKVIKWKNCKNKEELKVDDEITKLSDIGHSREHLDALVCQLLIGVYMHRYTMYLKSVQQKTKIDDSEMNFFGSKTDVYPNALSMYLMKMGKWKIPKNFIKTSFNQKSIEYIFEKEMTEDFQKGLWKELESMTKYAFRRQNGKDVQKTKQVRIQHLLVGCVILQEEADDWQTSQLQREELLRMKSLFSQQALQITNGVHEADKKQKEKRLEGKKDGTKIEHRINHAGRLLLNHGYMSDAIKTQNSVYLNDTIVQKVINQTWYNRESLSLKKGFLLIMLVLLHFLFLPLLMINLENKPLLRIYQRYNYPVIKVLLNAVSLGLGLVPFGYMLIFDFTDGISVTDWFLIGWMSSYFLDETKQLCISLHRKRFKEYVLDWWTVLDWITMVVYTVGMLLKLGDEKGFRDASKTVLVLAFMLLCIRSLNMLMISEIVGTKLIMIKRMFLDTFAFLTIMSVVNGCYCVSYYAILYSDNSDLSYSEIERIIQNGFWIVFGENELGYDNMKPPHCTTNKTLYKSGEMPRCASEWGLHLGPYIKAMYALITIVLLLNLLIAMYSHTFEEVHEKSKFYWSQLQTDFLEEFSVKSIFPMHFQLIALPACLVHFILWCIIHFLRSKLICPHGRADDVDNELLQDLEDGGERPKSSEIDQNVKEDEPKSPQIEINFKDKGKKLNRSPMFVRVFLYDTNFDLKLEETRDAEGQAALRASGNLEVTDEDKFTLLQRKIKHVKKTTENIEKTTLPILNEIKKKTLEITRYLYEKNEIKKKTLDTDPSSFQGPPSSQLRSFDSMESDPDHLSFSQRPPFSQLPSLDSVESDSDPYMHYK